MKKVILSTVLASTMMWSTASFANDGQGIDLPGQFSGTVTGASQYIFRGITQSDEAPAIQGSLDWNHDSGVYLGTWGSNVDFNDGDESSVEIDVYGGVNFSASGFDFGVGLIHYMYPGADSSLDYDYTEVTASVGRDFGVASATGSFFYSPDYFAGSGDSYYYNLALSAPITALPGGLTFNAAVGHQSIDDEAAYGTPDYVDWNVGLGATVEGFDLSLSYKDTDLSRTECADGCDGAVIFTISRTL